MTRVSVVELTVEMTCVSVVELTVEMARAVVNEAYRCNDMYNCDKPDCRNDVCKYVEHDC